MDTILPLITLFVGGAIAWIILKQIKKNAYVQRSEFEKEIKEKEIAQYKTDRLINDVSDRENEIKRLLHEQKILIEDSSNIKSLSASFKTLSEEKQKENDLLKIEIIDLNNEMNELREKLSKSSELLISSEEKQKNLNEKLLTQKEEIEKLGEKFTNEFKVLADAVLDEKSKKFTDQNMINIKSILEPLGERIKDFKKQVEDTYDKESKQRFSLESKIKELVELNQQISKEANNLTHALKGSAKTQGLWGEMILETILENSGLEKGREFFVQEYLRDEAGNTIKGPDGQKMQPDVLIKYPDGRNVIIDSKVSLNAYERYSSSENEEEQVLAMKQLLISVRNHIDGLSSKKYDLYAQSLDFVMMFVAIEPAYLLAIKQDSELWNYAYKKKILLISPTNLIAALKLVADLWKREHQNRNAFEIAERGGKLYDKFVSFAESLEDVGSNIKRAKKSYDSAVNQLTEGKGNIISQVEKLKELGVKAQKTIPPSLTSSE
jgi:DNA recombination protein RmuC